jgi:serine/threonine protein kinase
MAEKLLEIGSKFGDYTVVKLLGRGGMGEVYKITDGQTVYALKIMSPDRIEETGRMHEWRKRFVREAEAAMAIRHPNLVAVYDVGEDPQTHLCYILMEYVGGGSLSELIKAKGRLPIKEAVSIMVQAANGLSAAHKYGIVHRDIKPDNIMFDSEGTPKLMDLGIARFDNDDGDTTVTKTDMIIGTPAYMSPEQMMNSHNVDARADIYSLGVVLYEMLTGTRPRAQSTIVELLAKAIKGEELPDVRELRPEVSASLAYALSRLVALKASERPQSAAEAAKLVYDAVSGKILVKKPKKLVVALLKRRLRSRIKNLSMIAAGLVGLAGMVMFGLSLRRTGTVETVETVRREVVVTNKINVVEKVYVTNSVGKTIPVESPKVQETPEPETVFDQDTGLFATKAGGYWWFYKKNGNNAVLSWRKLKSGGRPCLEPEPEGRVVVPAELDGCKVTMLGSHAFAGCRRMSEIVLPESLQEICTHKVFLGCEGLTEVTLPKSLEKLGGWTFDNCFNLRRVDMSDCARAGSWFGCSFPACRSLEEITCSPENPAMVSVDGALYSRDRKTLIAYPKTRTSINLLPGTEKIAGCAFMSCNIRDAVLPEGVVDVAEFAFEYSNGILETVEFPNSMKRLDQFVFSKSDSLRKIVFHGDAPEIRGAPFGRNSADFVIEVERGSKGWNGPGSTDLPDRWPVGAGGDSRRIRYIGEEAPARQSASSAPAFREVPLASVPPEFKQDLEALGKRVSGRSKNGRLVFGRLQVEDGTPDDVATWVWLNPDGTFTATAIMALQRGIVFMKHGYEPLVVKLDGVDPKWRNDVAIDLGTVVMKKLPPEKTATLMLTPRLPEGVESGTFILRLVNNDPCGFDWGTMGRERPSRMVATTSFRNGETLKLPGCTPTLYSYTIEAPGCPTYSASRQNVSPGENDLGEVMLVRNKTASFAIRPLGETGGEWKRQKVLVNGNSWLVLTENKDSVGNRCLLYLAAYEKSGKGVNSHFGWGNTTCEDLGEMTVKEFERREKSGDLPAMDDKKQNFSLLPGHIYRLKNDWHWKLELLVAFEDYSENASKEDSPKAEVPKEDAPKEPERAVDLSKVLTCKANGRTWRYCLTDDGSAVLVGLDRVRNGVLSVPSKLDGHKVVAIGADAFAGCRSLTGIVLPDTIEEFGPRAFYYCSQLAEIKFPKSLRKMGDETFKKCHKLKRVNISMYSRQTEQEPIASQFRGCDKLERIDADPDNPVFVSVAGVLYSKDKTALVLYPHVRKGVNLLPSVRIIDRYAFAGWRGGDHIKLPEGVVEVRARAFEDAGRLSTVEFPRSLRRLGGVLFKDTSFGKVVFHGDAPERIPSEDSPFAESRSDFVVEVERGSKGWNRWNTDKCFHKIRYIK